MSRWNGGSVGQSLERDPKLRESSPDGSRRTTRKAATLPASKTQEHLSA
jgi:hypothetical protein